MPRLNKTRVTRTLTLAASVSAAQAMQTDTIIDLTTLGGTFSQGPGINDVGEVTGNARLASNAHLCGTQRMACSI